MVIKITHFLLLTLASCGLHSQNFIQAYQTRANEVTQTNITSLLQEFESYGVKTTGSIPNNNTLNWLKAKYQSYGYHNSQITEDTFTYNGNSSTNLIITKTGTVYPNTYIIICGHYDTIIGPGVSDNGSGTSIVLEAARILKDVPTEYSIKFIHFSGEEQGLLGSSHYVNNVVFQNNTRQFDIKLVLNIDQVGGKIGNNNNTINCESDQSGQAENNAQSLIMTQELAQCTTLYSPLAANMSNAYASDYMPFEAKGDIITGFYETIGSHNEHTIQDTFANIDPVYVLKVGKAAIGALQHFAGASTTILGVHDLNDNFLEHITIHPNPAKDFFTISSPYLTQNFDFELTDFSGKLILKGKNKKQINTSSLPKGNYLMTIKIAKKSITKKIILDK